MTDADDLRVAADYIDDARTPLDYGDVDFENEEHEEIIEELDEMCGRIRSTLRQMAWIVEVNEEGPFDDGGEIER